MKKPAVLTMACAVGLLVFAGSRTHDAFSVRIRLVEADSGKELAGLIQVVDGEGQSVAIEGLLARGTGLGRGLPIQNWWVLPGPRSVELPRAKYTIRAFSGLETETAQVSLDLTDSSQTELTIPLTRFQDPSEEGWVSANTHLHLQKISRQECDRYLSEIPLSDGLDVMFLSYLERAGADKQYVSNRYTADDLVALTRDSGVVFANGEEHRHNFAGFGQGYGHVMLLNIKKLILPVSIGPGIMKTGNDGLPLRRGIETARRDGATVVWCHNDWGMEAVPNWVQDNIDAHNIFDGGTHGSFKNSFYRYLNIGLKVPFSTGTDWFMYDFSRVYVKMPQGAVTAADWLGGLSAGRNYITNGPLLSFSVDNRGPGGTVALRQSGSVAVLARAAGRVDFKRIELVQNGNVVATADSRPVGGHFEAEFRGPLPVAKPGWLALRTPPPSVKEDPELQRPSPLNEFGKELFSHTSAVYVTVDGKSVFDPGTARALLAEMEASQKVIVEQGEFLDDQARARVLDVYRDGVAALKKRMQDRR